MKKIVLIILLNFIFILSVNAECTYQERKDLLEDVKNVTAYFEANTIVKSFDFYLYGLTDDIYVEIEDTNTGIKKNIYKYSYNEDYYSFNTNNVTKAVNYKLNYYSNKSNCYGDKILSKTVKKGIINDIAYEDICDGYEEYYYCKKVLDKSITLSNNDVYDKIYDYKKSLEKVEKKEELSLYNFFKNNWYYFVGVGLIGLISLIIIYINKKRGEL